MFKTADSPPIIQVDAGLSGGVLRYAEPVIMRAGCAACHNADPLSPRRDWVAGEVGGAQAVIVNLPALLPGFGNSAVPFDTATAITMLELVAALLGVTALMFLLLRRLKQSLRIAARRNLKLNIAREAAEAANASKSRLMANISHELRTPLNAILGFSEMISRESLGAVGNPKYRTYAGNIHQSGERLLAIIKSMVSYADLDNGKVDLNETQIALEPELRRLKHMMAPLTREFPRPVTLIIPPDTPDIRMDRRALRSILGNLLGNAIQYAGAGAQVWIIAGAGEDGVSIEVRDNGVGISARDLKRILLPFERVGDPRYANVDGIGLGLSIAQELAALQGTTLTIDSVLGKGVTATLHVPTSLTRASAAALPREVSRRAAAG